MHRLVILLVVCCSFSFVKCDDETTDEQKLCSENERFLQEGYGCQTCQRLLVKCALEKEAKCYCNPGYVRDKVSGKCVEYAECKKITGQVCPENESFLQEGYACQTCQRLLVRCALEKEAKCYCNPGYVRDKISRKCVEYAECKKITGQESFCKVNETYAQDGFNCQTCDNYAVVRCARITEPQCICIPGYVHNELTGFCVQTADCPEPHKYPICNVNETYSSNGISCATCSNYAVVLCPPLTEPQCHCLSGYVRNEATGICIETKDCPNKPIVCSENESYLQEGYACQTCQKLIVKCAVEKEPNCYCNSGYVRDTVSGKCVAYAECLKITGEENYCKVNETYAQEGYNCQTCNNYALVFCMGIKEPQCICTPGYVRNEETGICVETADCPKPLKFATIDPLCGVNEVFKLKGADCANCENYTYVKCAPQDNPGCYCQDDYVRNVNNVCTSKADCPP